VTPCQARPDSSGQVRCAACRLVWDAGDARECPREFKEVDAPPLAPSQEGFVSALAPRRI
jgi:hypothetical protein